VPRRRWTGPGFACVALAVAAVQAMAQAPAPSGERIPRLIPRTRTEREQRFVAQHRIILNVRVADASGKPQPDLNEADFTLYDNDQPRKLVSFRSVDANAGGAHVILVIDAVNNFTRQIHFFEREVESFLKEGADPLPVPVAIGVFSGYGINVGQSSRDRNTLLAELASTAPDLRATGCITQQDQPARMNAPFTAGGVGGARAQSAQELTCKNDRFVQSVNAISQLARKEVDVPGRLVLIWLGPGWPMLTDRAFAPDPPDLKRNFFEQLVVLSTALREAQVTMDAVASPDDSINPELASNVMEDSGNQIVTYRGLRRRTTRASDPGESLWVYGRNGQPCRRCGELIRRRLQGADARGTYWCPRCQPMPDGSEIDG
jgi:VWFA-related protein